LKDRDQKTKRLQFLQSINALATTTPEQRESETEQLQLDIDAIDTAIGRKTGVPRTKRPSIQAPVQKTLTREEAGRILREAGGDKDRARQIARQRGFKF